jgi:hypothetical protein
MAEGFVNRAEYIRLIALKAKFKKKQLPPYTPAGFDLTTLMFHLLGWRRYLDHAARANSYRLIYVTSIPMYVVRFHDVSIGEYIYDVRLHLSMYVHTLLMRILSQFIVP